MSLIPFVVTENYIALIGNLPVILIRAGGVNMPMCVDPRDATAILCQWKNEGLDWRSCGNLLKHLLIAFDAPPTKIAITGFCENLFVANVFVQRGGEEIALGSTHGEAIVLAMEFGVPMFIDEQVLIEVIENKEARQFLSFIEEQMSSVLEH